MLRAVPAMTSIAWSTSRAFRSCELDLGDRAQLRLGDPADLVPVRLGRALVEPERLLDQHGRRRRLRDEREGAVLEDRDLDRRDPAVLLRRLRVERLAELHDVDPVLAQRGADRRRRVGLPARDLQLDQCQNLLRHSSCPQSSFLTWSKPSSTGTWRSKMSTSTFSFCWSALTSTISPSKSDNGPEVTLTDSPSVNSTWERRAAPRGGGARVQDPVDLALGQRHGLGAGADEAGDAGRVLHDRPGLVVQIHVDEHVARGARASRSAPSARPSSRSPARSGRRRAGSGAPGSSRRSGARGWPSPCSRARSRC